MSILTHKMQRNRNIAYINGLNFTGSNCKTWFPCDEQGSTIITDVVGSVVETDLSATDLVPNSVSFGKLTSSVTSGLYPEIEENLLFVASCQVQTLESFALFRLGSAVFVNVGPSVASVDYGAGAGNGADTGLNALGVGTGDIVTFACAVIGDTLYHYTSVNGSGIVENGTIDASGFTAAFSGGNPTLEAQSTFGSTVVRQDLFGLALFTFPKATFTQSEIIAALNEIDGNWQNGIKKLPESIL